LTFEEYKKLVDSVIVLIKEKMNGMFKGNVIWKTTAAFEREKINRKPWPDRQFNYTMFRFLTPQVSKTLGALPING